MKKKDVLIGKNTVLEAIMNGTSIDMILTSHSRKGIVEIYDLAEEKNIPVKKVPVQKIDYLLFPLYQDRKPTHQGVIAVINPYEYRDIDHIYHKMIYDGKQPTFLFLDNVTDVGNFGAIARSCVCFDIDAIVLPSTNSVSLNSKSHKASAGALTHIPVCRSSNIIETIEYFINCGFQLVGASEKGDTTLQEVDFTLPTIVVMGSEGDGISRKVNDLLTHKLKIEMNTQKFNSLNVSVATGIILHHIYIHK